MRRLPLVFLLALCGCREKSAASASSNPEIANITGLAGERIRGNALVRDAVGEPMEIARWRGGGIGCSGSIGTAHFTLPVSGPHGKADVYVDAERKDSLWNIHQLLLTRADGTGLDLLTGKALTQAAPDAGTEGDAHHNCH